MGLSNIIAHAYNVLWHIIGNHVTFLMPMVRKISLSIIHELVHKPD
jgi:hypothetical protein